MEEAEALMLLRERPKTSKVSVLTTDAKQGSNQIKVSD